MFPNGLDDSRGSQIPPIWDVVSIAICADFAFRKINLCVIGTVGTSTSCRFQIKCVCIVRVRSIYVIDMNKQIPPIHDVIGTVRTSKSFRFQMSI